MQRYVLSGVIGMAVLIMALSCTPAAEGNGAPAIPGQLDLKPGFTPEKTFLDTKRYLAFFGSHGCEMGELNGIRPIYVVDFKAGLLPESHWLQGM